jgi:hypothetical protein
MAGYDTAGSVLDVYSAAYDYFGAFPNFWLRYFSPSPSATVVDSDPANDCLGVWDSGGPFLGPIMAPTQTRLAGSLAEGQADAETFCLAIYDTWMNVIPLELPTDGALYCWLDQEAQSSLSVDYWNGWSGYVGDYEWPSGTYPFFQSLYCDPGSTYANCSTLASSDAGTCYAVWSSEPESCSWASLAYPPTWDAESCSTVATKVWQYTEQGSGSSQCYSADVDLDVGSSTFSVTDACLYLTSEP